MPQQFDEYRLVRVLGSGSMGVVFLGHDTVLDRPVAIKFIRGKEITPRTRDRFMTEARAAARILHPNVMAIHRIGELEGRLYIISEFVRGKPLDALALPISWQEALTIGLGVARGLAAAHRHGVLHRDIKLANVMRSESGEVKLLDFGLAKLVAEDGAPVLVDAVSTEPMLAASDLDAGDLDDTLDASRPRLNAVTAIHGDHGRRPVPSAPESSHDEGLEIVVGTPYYMAPELWRAEPASRASDVYALGVLLYVLCAGHPPFEAGTAIELASLTQDSSAPPLRDVAPGVDPRFAKIIDRCLHRSAAARYPSADELCSALELLWSSGPLGEAVRGNPYRGLQAFEARHRAVFFGRAAEIRAVVDRLRGQPFVLVAGDSGVGKSSLCRAGVLPALAEPPGLGDRLWSSLTLIPGRRPLQTLLSALSSHLSLKEDELRPQLRDDPEALVRLLARRQGRDRGLVLFVDQLEEVITLAEPDQRDAFLRFLAALAGDVPSLRLLASVRGDFLTRAAALPAIGPRINAAVHILTPLAREGMRDAIAGPAALQGVHFEPEGLIDELVRAGVEGSLPLLQFALAELWEVREASSKVITAADLERIGRVTGALARHADNVIAGLPASQRSAARRMLLRLVTIEDTRASLALDDLVAGDPAGELALEALVAGRLVVAREAQDGTVHEIAHEALIRSWGALQRWIGEERETREIRHRLELAALEWQRLGHGRAGLWTAEQLAEASRLDETSLRRRERDFLAASATQRRRQRALRIALAATLPLVLGLVYTGIRVEQSLALQRKVHEKMHAAREVLVRAREQEREATRLRQLAFRRFDGLDPAAGESLWSRSLAATAAADALDKQAAHELEGVLGLEPTNAAARRMMTDVLYERAVAMENLHKPELAEELVERLKLYDDGERRLAVWNAPGTLTVTTDPNAQRISLARYVRDDAGRLRLGEPTELGAGPVAARSLEQGSYRLEVVAAGGEPIVQPFVVGRGELVELDLRLPRAGSVPDGFAFVPGGRFLYGSADDERIRTKFLLTVPQHPVTTGPYLIARRETTYRDWLAFVDALPPDERARRLPGSATEKMNVGVALTPGPDGEWQLTIASGELRHTARTGEPLVYPGRSTHATQDWLELPVAGISWDDARAYTQWLGRNGLPGARLCTEHEWERAVRGADGRFFPHGDRLEPPDANIDATYGRDGARMGPDAVGTHPASRSPFGLDDAVGNVWEWVESSSVRGEPVMRGGAFFYDEMSCLSANRYIPDPDTRDGTVGLRVCASVELASE